uniref:Uncharacterized protein n=1 Tax=Globodera pallida TaxID=36090 RepID=A0A183CST1_GLOPA
MLAVPLPLPLPLYFDRGQAPPKARRHYLPLSLSEWDVRIRNGQGGHCWNRGRRRSRSWISTDRSSTAGPIIVWEQTLPLGGEQQRAQNQTSPYSGRPSIYQRICESMTMLRSSSRHPPAGSSSPAAAKEEDGKRERAEDATSLDTWLTRRRHRRRNTLNLS